jgi:Sugar (and other) transporter
LIDRIGRRPILLVGSIGMAVSLALPTYTFAKATSGASGSLTLEGLYGPMALAAANAYVVFFNFSWGPVMWVMLGEMFPNQIRGTALAVSGLAQWGAKFAITMAFPALLAGNSTCGRGSARGVTNSCPVCICQYSAIYDTERRAGGGFKAMARNITQICPLIRRQYRRIIKVSRYRNGTAVA